MGKMESRALTEKQEREMADLYILVFDNSKKLEASFYFKRDNNNQMLFEKSSPSEKKATIKHNHDDKGTSGTVTLNITSGKKYIYGFANVDNNTLNKSYKDTLEQVKSIEKLKEVTISFENTQPEYYQFSEKASIPMSGYFIPKGKNNSDEAFCNINRDGNCTDGTIQLQRLFAKITFLVKQGKDLESFELTNWESNYLPLQSSLLPKENYDADNYAKTQTETPESYNEKEEYYRFDFYMLENRKAACDIPETNFTYAMRETPADNDNKENGKFKYVEDNATYIKLKGKLKMIKDKVTDLNNPATEHNGVDRYADMEYMIHLGGEEKNGNPDIDDFNVYRNTHYTYTITVNGVDNIVTKVTQDNDNIPGIDGDVIDMIGSNYMFNLDCHNHVFNIKIENVEDKPFLFRVTTPHGNYDNIDNKTFGNFTYNQSLLNWIQFRATKNGKLAFYNPELKWDGGQMPNTSIEINKDYCSNEKRLNGDNGTTPLMNLYELAQYVKRMKTGQKQEFTVFVKEYYYEQNPTDNTNTDTDWGLTNWNEFVNKDNRSVILDLNTKSTSDKQSHYSQGNVYITQKSIQTFYKSGFALGVEHENETGYPIWETNNAINGWQHNKQTDNVNRMKYVEKENGYNYKKGKYLTTDNGYYNQYMALGISKNTEWKSYMEVESPIYAKPTDSDYKARWENESGLSTLRQIKYTNEAIADCLARNCDENGDGYLQPEEMKWYLPASEQMYDIYLGAASLTTPLMNRLLVAVPSNVDKNKEVSYFHYLTSDIRTFWAEEGCSTGLTEGNRNYRIRCVRTLGTAYPTKTNDNGKSAYYFSDNETTKKTPKLQKYDSDSHTFTFPNLDDKNFRSKIVNAELTPVDKAQYKGNHRNFGEMNKLYKSFQMAKDFVPANLLKKDNTPFTLGGNGAVPSNMQGWTPCAEYSEKEDGSDKGTWRMPNQRELAVMYAENDNYVVNNGVGGYSCTAWYYNSQRIFGFSVGGSTSQLYLADPKQITITVIRCVRDVDVNNKE